MVPARMTRGAGHGRSHGESTAGTTALRSSMHAAKARGIPGGADDVTHLGRCTQHGHDAGSEMFLLVSSAVVSERGSGHGGQV